MAITPLHSWHMAHGGRMVDFAGTQLPVQFSSIVQEHQAVRRGMGWFDVSHMGRFRLSGPEARLWLDALLTCRLSDLPAGKVRYSLVCKQDGAILDDVLVYNLGGTPGEWALVVNASNRAKIYQWFQANQENWQAKLEDHTEQTAMVAVQGPNAVSLAKQLFDRDVADLPNYGCFQAHFGKAEVLVSRTGYTGEDGWEVCVPGDCGLSLVERLEAAGVTACGLGARDTLRLEASMPLYGHELSEEIDPYQAGLGRSVDLEKEFIGREALLRRRGRSDLPVRVGLVASGKRAARENDLLLDETGAEVGRVTSGTMSPTLGYPVAMAYVQPGKSVPGYSLSAMVRGRPELYTTTKMPFYRRSAV